MAGKGWRQKRSNMWQHGKLVLNKDGVPYKACWEKSLSLGEALYSFAEREETFWQLFHNLVCQISTDIGDPKNAGVFSVDRPSSSMLLYGPLSLFRTNFAGCYTFPCSCGVALACPITVRHLSSSPIRTCSNQTIELCEWRSIISHFFMVRWCIQVHHRPLFLRMVRWCIQETRLTLVCVVAGYLFQVQSAKSFTQPKTAPILIHSCYVHQGVPSWLKNCTPKSDALIW